MAFKDFAVARSQMAQDIIEESLMIRTTEIKLDVEKNNIMSVEIPKMNITKMEAAFTLWLCFNFGRN